MFMISILPDVIFGTTAPPSFQFTMKNNQQNAPFEEIDFIFCIVFIPKIEHLLALVYDVYIIVQSTPNR